MTMPTIVELKRLAAEQAVAEIRFGMVLGLGTGSTAALAVEAIARRIAAEGIEVIGVPTSEATAEQATRLGIGLTDLAHHPVLDLTIDGADAVEPGSLSLIKGLGGALLREKIVAAASRRMIVMVDDSKLRGPIGSFCPVPVEVVRFGWESTHRKLAALAARAITRTGPDGHPFVTDGGNFIIDCDFGAIDDAAALHGTLKSLVGVIETGLFIGLASRVIVAGAGGIEILDRSDQAG
jgi:ribose 5-phosphate isomerase A